MDRREIETKKKELRKAYGELGDRLAALFFRYDPVKLAYVGHKFVSENANEYEPEVGTILPRLRDCTSEADCLKVIHEEFCRWFGKDNAGEIGQYDVAETWQVWSTSLPQTRNSTQESESVMS